MSEYTLYGAEISYFTGKVRAYLRWKGIPFTEVNIEEEPEAVAFVMDVNNGNQTVPTLLFPDGSAATNPSINEVKKRLAS